MAFFDMIKGNLPDLGNNNQQFKPTPFIPEGPGYTGGPLNISGQGNGVGQIQPVKSQTMSPLQQVEPIKYQKELTPYQQNSGIYKENYRTPPVAQPIDLGQGLQMGQLNKQQSGFDLGSLLQMIFSLLQEQGRF